jgi:hypothetical protein
MVGCQLSLPSYFLDVMTGQATTFWKSDMSDHHDYHASVWTLVAYYISYVSWQVSRHLIWQDVNFWFPSYFLHVLTGHSFKNLTWPIFTIIMLACEHCLPWCISYVSWQVSKMMTWQGVNFGCPDVFPMCHDMSAKWWHGRVVNFGCRDVFPMCLDRSAKWWHGRVWTLVAQLFLRVMRGHYFQKNLTWPIVTIITLGCEHWLSCSISYVSWHVIIFQRLERQKITHAGGEELSDRDTQKHTAHREREREGIARLIMHKQSS